VVIDTGAFIAGVGILTGFDILTLTFIWGLKEQVGKDEVARRKARKALAAARDDAIQEVSSDD